ncbi:hypothetical protein HY345_03675 [Candidatus Microgenomates bacterium]|nr:hypothetical protein [Candidatus Microgenomates bacterium]
MGRFFSKIISFVTLVLSVILVVGVVKGDKGNPIFFQKESQRDARVGGPFESTNNSSRYVLTEAIVEDQTLFLNEQRTRFSSPDLVKVGDKYVSIFTPGISFMAVPFYIIGKIFGLPQLFSYLLTTVLAILNLLLIAYLATKTGVSKYLGLLGGVVFLFSSNALSYSATFTQHHASTLFILLCLLNTLQKRNFLNNLIFGFCFAASLTVDLPNAFTLLPLAVYVLYKNISLEGQKERLKISLKLSFVAVFLGMLPLISLFALYNKATTGSSTSLAQMIGRYNYPEGDNYKQQLETRKPQDSREEKSQEFELLKTPFETRFQASGFYILMLSDERSWLYYSPVILLGFLGLFFAVRQESLRNITLLSFSLIVMNILIYTMWGDPWGGWSFGPRYLIPAVAVMAAFVPYLLNRWRNLAVGLLVLALFTYSSYLSYLGGLTTNDIPPKQEAVHLIEPIPWTYEYNRSFIEKNQSSSLLYNIFLKGKIDLKIYHYLLTAGAAMVFLSLYWQDYSRRTKK